MTAIRRLLVPGLAALIALAILVGLGVWQVQRLKWKQALIAHVSAELASPPVAAPGPGEWPGLDLTALEYRPVTIRGHFDYSGEAYVVMTLTEPHGPVGGVGYLVMTPLVSDDGWAVYVNRGFVPAASKHPDTRKGGQIAGETTVTGLFRAPRDRSFYAPADDVQRNTWFSRDPALFAKAYGPPADRVAPYIIDAVYDPKLPGGLPQGGETIIDFPNSHLQYAITWFGLAAALVGVFFVFARRRLKAGTAGRSAG